MRGKRFFVGVGAALAIFAATLVATDTWAAARGRVLYSFNNYGTDGSAPCAGLIFDTAGSLYGTTSYNSDDYGTVFSLTKRAEAGPRRYCTG
jgi:hypothetical protein